VSRPRDRGEDISRRGEKRKGQTTRIPRLLEETTAALCREGIVVHIEKVRRWGLLDYNVKDQGLCREEEKAASAKKKAKVAKKEK